MPRTMFPIVLVLLLTLMSLSNHAMAFTVRFGPVSAPDSAALKGGTSDADIPTPLLFNLAVGSDGLTFGPRSTAPETPAVAPTLKMRSQTQASVAAKPAPSHERNLASSHQLSGVEIMLLQDAHQVAAR